MRTRQKARLEAAAQNSAEPIGYLSSEDVVNKVESTKPVLQGSSKELGDFLSLKEKEKTKDPVIPQTSKQSRDVSSGTVTLSSTLNPGPTPDLYFSCDPNEMLDTLLNTGVNGSQPSGGIREKDIMKDCVITADFERRDCAPPISVSKQQQKKMNQAARAATTGSKWFDMPAPQLTPELKNDLRLLQMRNALDPSRHYKANDSKKPPRFFQVGRIVADSADFYSSRIPRRQRKQTLVDELLADEEFRRYHKNKYAELQKRFASGTGRKKTMILKKKFKKKV